MSQDNVSKIKERLGIKEVIEDYIKLEKAGSNYKGRCPFHNDKTPSFFVSPERESYYCFGCGAKGDIFTFVQEFEGTDFVGALKILANKAGIELEKINYQKNSKTKIIKDILEEATSFFEEQLKNNSEVKLYLEKRGIKEKTILEWRIGFAPSGWRNIFDHLKKLKYLESDIERAGFIKKNEKGEYYDRFRSRVMFPIFNSMGEVIAFSGRIFGSSEEMAKYINSPETEVFKKSEVLYGLDKAKKAIRKNNFTILVEGQMDTIMCYQAGYKNVVASSGTALTETQLKNINKLSNNLVIAFDSDSAGFSASEKAWGMALSLGMDVKIAPLRGGLDPADLIKEDIKKWKEVIKNSQHIIDALIDKINDSGSSKRKINQMIVKEIIPHLSSIKSRVDQHYFTKKISDKFNLPIDVISEEVKNYQKNGNLLDDEYSTGADYEKPKAINTRERDELSLEKRLFGILYYFEKKDPSRFEEIQKGIVSIVGKEEYDKILESINNELEEIIFAVENSFDYETVTKESTELIKNLKIKKLNKKRKELLLELKSAEITGDEKIENDLLKEINNISKEIQKNI